MFRWMVIGIVDYMVMHVLVAQSLLDVEFYFLSRF